MSMKSLGVARLTSRSLSALLRQNAEYQSDYVTAEATVGAEVAAACQSWAQTTILPNDDAFGMCWRAGGPGQAERSLIYHDAAMRTVRRLYRI